jgi:hypothetical protein
MSPAIETLVMAVFGGGALSGLRLAVYFMAKASPVPTPEPESAST